MQNFKNVILIVVFNYSNCVCNKDIIKTIYERHFKQIIFYSDYPEVEDDEVNYVDINRGINVEKFMCHFYKKYMSLIDDSDGIFIRWMIIS